MERTRKGEAQYHLSADDRRTRDTEIEAFATVFPVTVRTLYEMGWFESYTTAAVWMKRAVDEGRMPKHVAYLAKKGKYRDHEERLYCKGYRIAQRNARHHYQATRFAMMYWPWAQFTAGPWVDKDKRPDAEMTVEYDNGVMEADIEIDCDTEDRTQWQEHLKPFVGGKNLFIVVAPEDPDRTLDRLEELKEWTVYDSAYFTTLAAVEDDPHGFIWWHCENGEWELVNLEDPETTPEVSSGQGYTETPEMAE